MGKGLEGKWRSYSLVRDENRAGCFLRLGVMDLEMKRYSIFILKGRGERGLVLYGGDVTENGSSHWKEGKQAGRVGLGETYYGKVLCGSGEDARSRGKNLVRVEVREEEISRNLSKLEHCLVGCWNPSSARGEDLEKLGILMAKAWGLKGKLVLARMEKGKVLLEFESLVEAKPSLRKASFDNRGKACCSRGKVGGDAIARIGPRVVEEEEDARLEVLQQSAEGTGRQVSGPGRKEDPSRSQVGSGARPLNGLNLLGAIRGLWSDPWCIGGDFNLIRFPNESRRGGRLSSSMRRFSKVIDDLDLRDLPLQGGPFAWSGGLNNQAMTRLDRFLVSEDWEGHFKGRCSVLFLGCVRPLPYSTGWGGVRRGPVPFRFENMWLKEEGFKDLLKGWWQSLSFNGSFSFILVEKLKALKAILKSWNKDVFGQVGVNKKVALDKVSFWDGQEKLRPLSLEELEARKVAKGDFEKWALMEEVSWIQKSREVWLREGDRNTGLDFNRIGDEDAARLEEVFSEEEVLKALSDLNGDKAPGPDGFLIRFWQFCWDVVKEEIMGFLLDFHECGRFVRSLNSIFLVLIPKKPGAEDLRDFRPISLVGGLYKLLAKVLANKLKKVVGKVVSSAQNAFVEGRQILDAALIANEAIDSLLKRNESGVLCKLDLEKAYDHINWNFLLFVLQSMGFGEKWIGWISWCISTTTFSVLINGTPEGYFNSSRGLRQGDPLSPYLFVIGMEALSRLIHRAVGGGFLSGCRVDGRGGNGALVSHLLFADDTLVFCEASEDQMVHLSWLLMWFEAISGLRINLDKSEILPVGRVENLENLALEAGCKVGRLPSSYLGIPLGANHKSVAVWDGVEERFRKRLTLWKRQFISKGGRITLIRSTLSSMPIYLMSLLRMPRVVSLRLEKIQRDFLWGGGALERKPHLVNWDTVCMDKRKGGLGVRRLSILNRALLCKWNWRFAIERENFWRHVISRKFGEEEGGWSSREVRESYGVGFWKEIRKEGALMQNKVAFLVGNGRRVKFWKDIWWGNFPLCNSFPSLYAFVSSKEAWVEEFWDTSGVEGAWSPRFSRPFNDWEVEEVERLLLTI
ncbi:LINE-1 reverse transcriptase-like [Vitis vinifera]|uniref:LINE-1 reverse transcriptase-like n=1 Tax=Vitis vinifera TaxID=29760 RepID=A0A438BWJ2_VITVI|nr:LINE-1 reverse transcriptase-like [Vitis vinifera]